MSQLSKVETPLVPMSCDEKNFIEQCKTLGLSSEQVFELLKLKLKQEKAKVRQEELRLEQEKVRLEIELFKLKAGSGDDHEIKKRKFEEINNHDEEQAVKKERKYSEIFCDDVLLNILQYLNRDFVIFKYILVSKQFRNVINNSIKNLSIENSNQVPAYALSQIEKVEIFSDYDVRQLEKCILKCTNIKYLYIDNLCLDDGDRNLYLQFKKPTIEAIKIESSSNNMVLSGRNLYNLKVLELTMETPGLLILPGIINNYTACLRVLKIDDVFKDITPLFELLLLSKLDISVNNNNQLILLINKMKKLEILTVQLFNNEDNSRKYDVDTQLVVNLKCLRISSSVCGIGNVWKYNFSNLKILKVFSKAFTISERQLLTNNSTLKNLESLECGVDYISIGDPVNISNLKSLMHINVSIRENIVFSNYHYENLESLKIGSIFRATELRNFKQLRRFFLNVDNVEQLMEFIKLDSLRNLKLIEITTTKNVVFPIEFFKELENFIELTDLYCSFSIQQLELLKQFKPPQLKQISIYPPVSNLVYKFLIEWEEDFVFDVNPANGFTEFMELQISNFEDKLLLLEL